MKILLGTPIHESKDYCIKEWLAQLSQFDSSTVDVLLVDNSDSTAYINTLDSSSYEVYHIEVDSQANQDERISRSREVIRQRVIDENYDYWFSLESDVFVPSNTITELLRFGDEFHAVHHCYPSRYNIDESIVGGFGCSLIKKEALEEFGFLLEYGKIDSLNPNCWHGSEEWFNTRIFRNGWKYCILNGILQIEHRAEDQ